MNKEPEVSAVVVAHNDRQYLPGCIELLKQFLPVDHEIIVVDNDSTDGTGVWLSAQTFIKTIHEASDHGLYAAFNHGAKQARGQYLLFMHSDVLLSREAYPRMKQCILEKNVCAVGGDSNRTRHYFGVHLPTYRDVNGFLSNATAYADAGLPVRPAIFLEDFCLLVKRTAFEKVHGFDENFTGIGFGDGDLSLRLRRCGFDLMHVPVYVHHQGTGRSRTKEGYPLFLKNEQYFQSKWGFSLMYSSNIRYELLAKMDVSRPELTVLDIGCSCGGNLMQIRYENPTSQCYGIELSKGAAKVAAQFGKVSHRNIEEVIAPEWKNKFDYIIMGDVIEHLRDPWGAIKNVAHWLASGGAIITSVPNVLHISNLAQMLQGHWRYTSEGILDQTHLRFFTRESIEQLFVEAGLQVDSMESIHARATSEQKALIHHLTSIPGVTLTENEMVAWQWAVVAHRR